MGKNWEKPRREFYPVVKSIPCAPCTHFIPVKPKSKFSEYSFRSTQEDLFGYYEWIKK